MKPYRIYFASIIIGLIMSALFLNSCFEHNQYQASKYKNIFMPQSQGQDGTVNREVVITDSAQTITYSAAYNGAGGPNNPGSDIPVQFNVKPALVDSFNTFNGTSYPILPKDSYELSRKEATIPGNKLSTDKFDLNVTTEGHLQVGSRYLLPVTLSSTEIKVNESKKTAYFLFTPEIPSVEKTYNFDNGTKEGWTFDDSNFTLKSDQSYSGEYSIGGTAISSNDLWAHIEPSELNGGAQIYSLSFKYFEGESQTGAGIRVLDSNGEMIAAAATGNPNYNTYGANGYKKHGMPTSRNYEVWVKVKIAFDWIDGTAEITFTDTQSGESETHSVSLAENTNVRRLEIANYGSAGNGGFESGTNNPDVRVDDIELTMPLKQ